jgi:hypothetical protein
MAENTIPNPNPITIPAKTYDKQYCTTLTISASPSAAWNAAIVGQDYDGDVSLLDQKNIVRLKDLKALALVDAELSAAMAATLAVVGKYLVLARAAGVKVVTAENVAAILGGGQ